MKWLLTLLLAFGILVVSDVSWAARLADKEKDEKKEDKDKKDKEKSDKDKKDKDKSDKEKDKKDKDKDAKDKEKDKGKVEEKLTKEQEQDLEKMSGTFGVTTFEREGKKSSDDDLKKMKVIQKKAEWSFHFGDEITTGIDKVYPDKKPKEIDSTYTNGTHKGRTVKGVYEIDGDTVKYCWGEVGKDRPKDFTTKTDSGTTLMILKKGAFKEVKEKDKEKEKGKPKDDKKDDKKDKDKK